MNKAIEAVLNNQGATAKEYFELINLFDCSSLMLQNDKQATPHAISMEINAFKEVFDGFEFLQEFSDTQYTIHKSAIESVEGKMLDGMDTFYIKANMADGSQMDVFIYNIDTSMKTTVCEDCYDIDVLELKKRLENYKPTLVKFEDTFGLSATVTVSDVYLIEEEEGDYTLHITDRQFTFIDIPLKEDSCNKIFFREDRCTSFVIKPYGQPFMEIQILVNKNDEDKPNLSVVK